jgi:erythrin-vacuolar iron transport family protein
MPAIDVRTLTLQDALDLAIAIEEEAQARYDGFAKITGGRYEGDAADMFRQMASYESRHREELATRRRHLFGNAPARVTAEDLDDVEAPHRGSPRVFMSARQALEVALASEEKARDFFSDALGRVDDREVHALFQDLVHEEEKHVRLVQERLDALPQGPGPDVEEDEADAPGSDPGN